MSATDLHRRKFSWFLISFAALILVTVIIRQKLASAVPVLSSTAKWASQLLIVASGIYALFVSPYDKERGQLSRAGVITICSIFIAFTAFALSDWKDTIAAKEADKQKQDQIDRLNRLKETQEKTLDTQRQTLQNQAQELIGIKEVSGEQAKTSSKLTEQAEAQDKLLKDAQQFLRQQEVTINEVTRAQQPLGVFKASARFFIPDSDPVLQAWARRLADSKRSIRELSWENLLNDPNWGAKIQ